MRIQKSLFFREMYKNRCFALRHRPLLLINMRNLERLNLIFEVQAIPKTASSYALARALVSGPLSLRRLSVIFDKPYRQPVVTPGPKTGQRQRPENDQEI